MTRVSELAGTELALWVAKACGLEIQKTGASSWVWVGGVPNGTAYFIDGDLAPRFEPHENWTQGGPLLEGNAIGFRPISDAEWEAEEYITGWTCRGPNPLIAAMRALVASVYGDSVPGEVQP